MASHPLPSYVGRSWALKLDLTGQHPTSVHHFSSEEVRDGWVHMDPDTRVPVDRNHPTVREWLGEKSIWERIKDYIRSIFP